DLPGSTSHVSSSSGEDSAPSDSSSSLDDSTGDPPSCGNGVLDPGEDCDPTAPESDACCTAECTIARLGCGNGCAERGEWCWDDAMLDEHPLLTGDLVAISVGDVNADGDADLI